MAEELRPLGLIPRFGQRVDDQLDRILGAFEVASRRSDIILVTGGLGPTSDDLTAEAFGKFLGEGVALNAEALAQIQAIITRMGRLLIEQQKKQAYLPPSCFVIPNPEGTAPGFGLERMISGRKQMWFFMPGVPREMIPMLKTSVLPKLPRSKNYRSTTWATQFTAESELQAKLKPIEARLPAHFEVTYRTRFPENFIALYADCQDDSEEKIYRETVREIESALGSDFYACSQGNERIASIEEVVVRALKRTKAQVVTVESATGGLLAGKITEVPGSSEILWGGLVVYDERAKTQLASVSPALLAEHGAVSQEVAQAMAEGGLKLLLDSVKSDSRAPKFSVSITGTAGPSGGTPEKPVGLCYIGISSTLGPTVVKQVQGRPGFDRARNRALFAQKALDYLRRAVEDFDRLGVAPQPKKA